MATLTSWVEHLSAEEVGGVIYPLVGFEWLWLTIAVVFWLWFHIATGTGESEEHKKLARKAPSANAHKSNITEW